MEYSDDDKSLLSGFVRRKMKMDMMDDEVFQGALGESYMPNNSE